MAQNLKAYVESFGDDPAYKIYRALLPYAQAMMDESAAKNSTASDYWEEELAGFDYMLDASPMLIRKLREHCYHITGIRSYEYRAHHAHAAPQFEAKLDALHNLGHRELFVPESEALGGFGHIIGGKKINIDTLKFYETLIGMKRANLLPQAGGPRKTVMEIGAGWGGFAYQFKTLFPNTTYVIVDLPGTMLFSLVYLHHLFPNAKTFVYGRDALESLNDETIRQYDFVFIPHYAFEQFSIQNIDVAINMVSFQEMAAEHVDLYLRRLRLLKCKAVYSHNREHSKHNTQLKSVTEIIRKYYATEELKLLPVSYTSLSLSGKKSKEGKAPKAEKKSFLLKAKDKIKQSQMAMDVVNKVTERLDYKHIVGRLKSE